MGEGKREKGEEREGDNAGGERGRCGRKWATQGAREGSKYANERKKECKDDKAGVK